MCFHDERNQCRNFHCRFDWCDSQNYFEFERFHHLNQRNFEINQCCFIRNSRYFRLFESSANSVTENWKNEYFESIAFDDWKGHCCVVQLRFNFFRAETIRRKIEIKSANFHQLFYQINHKKKIVVALLLRLQFFKIFLNFMISTMIHRSIENAQKSVNQLIDVVRQFLKNNQNIFEKLNRMKSKNSKCVFIIIRTTHNSFNEKTIQNFENIITMRQINVNSFFENVNSIEISNSRFEFECFLKIFRFYVKIFKRSNSFLFTISSVIQTLNWFYFSNINLTEMSNIFIFELIFDKHHIWNSTRYDIKFRYLSTVAEGWSVEIYSYDAFVVNVEFGFDRCKKCGEIGSHLFIVLFFIFV